MSDSTGKADETPSGAIRTDTGSLRVQEPEPSGVMKVLHRMKHIYRTRMRTTTVVLVVVWIGLLAFYGFSSQHYAEPDNTVNQVEQQVRSRERVQPESTTNESSTTTSVPSSEESTGESTTTERGQASNVPTPTTSTSHRGILPPIPGLEPRTETDTPSPSSR